MLSPILLFACVAFATDTLPSCELAKESIVSRSSPGLAQVSNLGGIRITCRVPTRPFPTTPGGEPRYLLKVATTAYEISADGTKKLVPSEVHVVGGGGGGFGPEPEWVEFDVLIPLDSKELDAEVHRYLAKLVESMTREQKAQITQFSQNKALENIRQLVYQNRVGHFQLECRVLDGSRVMGANSVEFEVLFKGRFSDVGCTDLPFGMDLVESQKTTKYLQAPRLVDIGNLGTGTHLGVSALNQGWTNLCGRK